MSKPGWLTSFARLLCLWLSLLTFTAILCHAAMLWGGGDVWWMGTVVLFAPRWPLVFPLAVVAGGCALWRRRLLWLHAAGALVLAGPVMGFRVPIFSGGPAVAAISLRVFTINVGAGADPERVKREIDRLEPDVVALQECRESYTDQVFDDTWYRQQYGALCIASRMPIDDAGGVSAKCVGRWSNPAMRVRLHTPAGDVWVCCVHIETPRHGLDELALSRYGVTGTDKLASQTEQRALESAAVRRWAGETSGPMIIAGDFNMPVESRIYRRDWGDYQNAFSRAGWGRGHTKIMRRYGVRIDHILTTDDWHVPTCRVGQDTGGDHRGVVAEVLSSN